MGMSVALAETLSGVANVALVISLLIGVAATYVIVVTGGVKESGLKGAVGMANAAAAKAQVDAAKANERAEALHQENLKTQTRLVAAERELEAERLHRLELEASVAPRILSPKQSEKLIAVLAASPRPLSIHLNFIGDEEANKYALAIAKALETAKVRGRADGIGMIVPPPYGVAITLKANDPQGAAIRAAFEGAQIPAIFSVGETGGFDAVILVGLRPLGPNH